MPKTKHGLTDKQERNLRELNEARFDYETFGSCVTITYPDGSVRHMPIDQVVLEPEGEAQGLPE